MDTKLRTYLRELEAQLMTVSSEQTLRKTIVNAPFYSKLTALKMGLGIVVLLYVNTQRRTIDRIALSNTDFAQHALDMSEKKFHQIRIPLNNQVNIITRAIKTNQPQFTTNWEYLFVPEMSGEAARFNQAAAGIECSYVYPLFAREGGALIYSYFLPQIHITENQQTFMKLYTEMVNRKLSEETAPNMLLQG
jgi:hypothetical protein